MSPGSLHGSMVLIPFSTGWGFYRIRVVGEVINRPVYIADIRREPRYIGRNPNIRSELFIPLVTAGKTIGVVNAESNRINAFSRSDERFVVAIAKHLTTEIEKTVIFQLTTIQRRIKSGL